jgi:hypothetical protein
MDRLEPPEVFEPTFPALLTAEYANRADHGVDGSDPYTYALTVSVRAFGAQWVFSGAFCGCGLHVWSRQIPGCMLCRSNQRCIFHCPVSNTSSLA